jgi:hypothetical protein
LTKLARWLAADYAAKLLCELVGSIRFSQHFQVTRNALVAELFGDGAGGVVKRTVRS